MPLLGGVADSFRPFRGQGAQIARVHLLTNCFPDAPSSAIHSCVGDGMAFGVITNGAEVILYGIELDACLPGQLTGLGLRMAVRVVAAIYIVAGSPPIFGKLRNPA